MVDVLGHLAMSLFAAVPVWFVLDKRPAVAFLGFVLLAALIPDIDLYLPWAVHHGPTHTILFVTLVAFAGGAVAVLTAPDVLHRWSPWADDERPSPWVLLCFPVSGLLLGGLVHVVFDMLSTSSTEQVVEPFWPFFDKPFSFYIITTFSKPIWNSVPFVLALLLHALAYRRVSDDGVSLTTQ